MRSEESSLGRPAQKLRQHGDIHRDPPRLIAGSRLVQTGKVGGSKKEEHKGNFKKHKRCDKKVAHHQNFTNSTTDNIRLVEIGCEMLTRGRNNSGSLAMFTAIVRALVAREQLGLNVRFTLESGH
jgi:hypothetical protein